MDPLTQRQLEVLGYIADAHAARGASPTLREIAAAFDVSVPRVQAYLRIFRAKGYVATGRYVRRGIRPIGSRRAWKAHQSLQGDFDRRIGAKLRDAVDLGRVFDVVHDDLRAWLGADGADLYLPDAHRRELRASAFYGSLKPGAPAMAAPVAEEGSPVARAFRRRRPVVEGNIAAVPVLGRERAVGVLRIDVKRRGVDPSTGSTSPTTSPPGAERRAFSDATLSRAGMAAAALAPALERATLHAELQRSIRAQTALLELVRAVNSVRGFRDFLREVKRIVHTMVDATLFLIGARDEAGQWWMLMETDEAEDGTKFESTAPRTIVIGHWEALSAVQTRPWWIRNRTPEEVRALEASGPSVTSTGFKNRRSRSILYVPLRVAGETVGFISAQSYRYNAYSIREAEELVLIGEYVGMAVRSALRDEQARAGRERDRRRLERLDREEAEARARPAAGDREAAERHRRLVADLAAIPAAADPARSLAGKEM